MSKHKEFRTSFTYEGHRYTIEADTEVDMLVAVKLKRSELESGARKKLARNMTVEMWGEEYIETYRRDSISHEYYKNLCTLKKVIDRTIGNMLLRDVKKIHCLKVLTNMKGLSREYITKTRGLMFSMFEEAIENDLLLGNPATHLKIPANAVKKKKRRPATDEEKRALLTAGSRLGDPYEAYIILMLYFGLRPSEASRVQGCHFDLSRMRLRVQGTKSASATRDVPVPDHLVNWISKYSKDPFALIIKNRDGYQADKHARQRMWEAIRRDVNLAFGCEVYRNQIKPPYAFSDDLTAYCLRHTFASDLIAKGVPKEIVSLLMGHADIDVTDVYISMTESMFELTRKKINAGLPAEGIPGKAEIR